MPEEKKVEKKTVAAAPAPAPASAPKNIGGGDKDSNLLAALSYIINLVLLPWSFAIYFVKKEDRFVRFHAMQAGILWVIAMVISVVLMVISVVVGMVLGPLSCVVWGIQALFGLAFLAADLYAAYMAYQGTKWEMPVIGGFASSHAG
jgi:uncharacterized membrane protein